MSGGPAFILSALLAVGLVCFSARRLLLLGAALLPPRRADRAAGPLPTVTLLVPARNEGVGVEGTLESVRALDYPDESLFVVLVDDASDDDTGARIADWVRGHRRARALHLAEHTGKGGALNAGIAVAPPSELVAVCDADLRPRPDWLQRLVPACAGDGVGGAAAFLRPSNSAAGAVTRYAALETWTHQLVTSAGKDRLDLNPPLLGACVYRRVALESVGGFRQGVSGEDVHSTLALTRERWVTRFVAEAVVENTLVCGWREYWRQHIRWSRNLFAAGDTVAAPGPARSRPSVPLRRRAESWFARSGYADRLVFAAALSLTLVGALAPWFCAAYGAVAAIEAAAATARAGEGRRLHRFLWAAVILFPLDVIASATAALAHVARRPRNWRTARRAERAPEGA